MKHVVSVSLGSTAGDFEREIDIGDQRVRLSREGTNGDIERARARICELDGKIDAIGLGGIDIYLYVAGEQLIIGDGLRLAQVARKTPVVDGSGLKNTLEREVIRELATQGRINSSTRVLMVSALDRFGMAETLVELGCSCVFGDLIFNIGLDFPLTKLSEIEDLAKKYKSRLMNVPFHMLYPTGSAQDEKKADPRYARYYERADVIAGDAHLILRHMPERLHGKGIITNTTRPHTMARFTEAGIDWVVTTTPELNGISGGTNLMEAALVALMEKPFSEIRSADYKAWTKRLGWQGAFQKLGG